MTPRAPHPAPPPPTLADQKADFTAEGSPPPGKVASTPPLTPAALATPAPSRAPKLGLKPGPEPKSTKSTKAAKASKNKQAR